VPWWWVSSSLFPIFIIKELVGNHNFKLKKGKEMKEKWSKIIELSTK
jgi:hypothetical protein